MNKKPNLGQVSQEEALKKIKNAQKYSNNKNYQEWCSPSAKSNLGDTTLSVIKNVVIFSGFFICFLAVAWLVLGICVAYYGEEAAKGAIWLQNKINSLADILVFKIFPPSFTFIVGKIWGKSI